VGRRSKKDEFVPTVTVILHNALPLHASPDGDLVATAMPGDKITVYTAEKSELWVQVEYKQQAAWAIMTAN